MNKIYDTFLFFNELDLLEIRLNVLSDYVDYFVLVESSITHAGMNKPFYFEENKTRFSEFLPKIIHLKVYDTPNDFINLPTTDDIELNKIYDFIRNENGLFNKMTELYYGRDYFQKESIRRALSNCSDDDIIIFSDLDEIPNINILSNISKLDIDSNIYSFKQNTYYYYLNCFRTDEWYGSKVFKYEKMKNISLNRIRNDKSLSVVLDNGGWHFSYMGGVEIVKQKMKNFSHSNLTSDKLLNSLSDNMNNNIGPFFGEKLEIVSIDTLPEYVLDNIHKYSHMIKNK